MQKLMGGDYNKSAYHKDWIHSEDTVVYQQVD